MPKADLAAYAGKEQAYVKHYLLDQYLVPLAYKVGSAWESIVYIDGFSGPWHVNDPNFADSSFAVAIEALRRAYTGLQGRDKSVRMQIVLVEANKQAFQKLEAFSANKSTPGFGVKALCGEFVDQIPAINSLIKATCRSPFRFVFLDPKGWADIPMRSLQPFLKDRSCEVLINLMTRHIIRFLDEADRAESYQNLFGRPGVLEKLRDVSKENNERADQAVREYCRSLTQLCDFKYVSSAVILEPDEESVRYFLVYATNDFHGIEVFKQAETATARTQDDIRHETRVRKTGQPEFGFDEGPPKSRLIIELRERYRKRARKKMLQTLLGCRDAKGATYESLFCEAMAFPLVTPEDLENWVRLLIPHAELRLAGSAQRKKPSPAEDDRVVVINAQALANIVQRIS
jgi:three-Cys-motif partner protein